MKKRIRYYQYIKLLIILVLLFTFILSIFTVIQNQVTDDENKFKYQYMELNGKNNLSSKKYVSINIPDQNKVHYLSGNEVVDFLKEKTGILYFCFQQGNACRKTSEILTNLVKDSDISSLYYRNIYGDRDEVYLLDDGSLWTMKESSENYKKIIDLLSDYLPVYEGLKDDSKKRIYLPSIVFVKKGKILKYISLNHRYDYDESKRLSSKDQNKIENEIIKGIQLLKKDD